MMRGSFLALLLLPTLAFGKNVVFFLGDGMGISTVTAARIFAGQLAGKSGEEHELAFDRFGNVALIKVYNVDAQVPDSAGTISAILTGQKTRIGVFGITAEVERGDCAGALANEIPSLLQLAEQAGRATGVIATARVTHATPAGAYAHSPDRNWEADTELPPEAVAAGCRDIARQLVEFPHGDGIEVVLGGGRAPFLPAAAADPEYPDRMGQRADGRNLVDEWLSAGPDRSYVWNAKMLDQVAGDGPVLGLFEPSHMQFEADRANDGAGEPSLSEMTRFALERLVGHEAGFFLLIEAGRIDHGHHASNAYRALVDTVELSNAVQTAVDMVDLEETLVLVTADHSHTLTIAGYPPRGNPILGTSDSAPVPGVPESGGPYTTLSYANGPGFKTELPDLSEVDTTDPDYRQLGTIPMMAETHSGEDVAAYATGKNADAVRGVMEQNALFEVMRAALFDE